MLSPTSINEKITYVYILKAKNSTPNLTSHQHPQVKLIARVSVAGVSPAHHWVWTQDLFVVPGPRRVYTSEWPKPCTQPLPTYCQKHAKAVSTTSSWENIKVNGSLLQAVQNYPLLLFSLTAQLGHILVVSKHKLVPRYYTVYECSPRRQTSWNQLGVLLRGSLTWLNWKRGVGPNCIENEENFGLEWCWMALWIETLASAPSCRSSSQKSCTAWLCPGGKTKAPQVVFPHVLNIHKWGQTKPSVNKAENPKTNTSHGKGWRILPILQRPVKLSLMP